MLSLWWCLLSRPKFEFQMMPDVCLGLVSVATNPKARCLLGVNDEYRLKKQGARWMSCRAVAKGCFSRDDIRVPK